MQLRKWERGTGGRKLRGEQQRLNIRAGVGGGGTGDTEKRSKGE